MAAALGVLAAAVAVLLLAATTAVAQTAAIAELFTPANVQATLTGGVALSPIMVAADMDHDGDMDVVVAASSLTCLYFLENCLLQPSAACASNASAQATFMAFSTAQGELCPVSAQLDSILIDYGFLSPTSLLTADFNNDTWPDLVAGTFFKGAYLQNPRSHSPGTFNTTAYFAAAACLEGAIVSTAAADFNNDGTLDVACLATYVIGDIWFGVNNLVNGTVTWTWYTHFIGFSLINDEPHSNLNSIAAADLDGDGLADLVVGWPSSIFWVLNSSPAPGQIRFVNSDVHLLFQDNVQGVEYVTTVDIDLDLDLDILFTLSQDNAVYVCLNQRNHPGTVALAPANVSNTVSFSAPIKLTDTCLGSAAVIVADLDGDQDTDILLTCPGSSQLIWLENLILPTGVGNPNSLAFATAQTIPAGSQGIQYAFVADVTMDGRPDIIVAASAVSLAVNTQVSVLANLGSAAYFDDVQARNNQRKAEVDFLVLLQHSVGINATQVLTTHPCSTPKPSWVLGSLSCTADGNFVSNLDMSGLRLAGTLPEGWQALTKMTLFNAGENNLTGPVPASLAQAASLTMLNLSANAFTGSFPTAVCTHPFLSCSALGHQQQYCFSPTALAPSCVQCSIEVDVCVRNQQNAELSTLQHYAAAAFVTTADQQLFSANTHPCAPLITGPSPTLPQIGCSTGLVSSLLFSNIPMLSPCTSKAVADVWQALGQQLQTLQAVSMQNCGLSCNASLVINTITAGSTAAVQQINLRDNQLTGDIDTSVDWLRFTSLVGLNLKNNNLTGSITADFAMLSQLVVLDLSGNQFDGVFPDTICSSSLSTCSAIGPAQQYCVKSANCGDCAVQAVNLCPLPLDASFTALIVIVPIVGMFAVLVAAFFAMRLLNKRANNFVVCRILWALFQLSTNIVFLFSVQPSSLSVVFTVGLTFLIGALATNFALALQLMSRQLGMNQMRQAWFERNLSLIALFSFFAVVRADALLLLSSRIGEMQFFSFDWSAQFRKQVWNSGLASLLMQTLPLCGLQLYFVIVYPQLQAVQYLALVVSAITSVVDMVDRCIVGCCPGRNVFGWQIGGFLDDRTGTRSAAMVVVANVELDSSSHEKPET